MAELDDLKAAVATLTTAITDVTIELTNVATALVALKNQGSINPADVGTAAKAIADLATNLENAVSSAKTSTGV